MLTSECYPGQIVRFGEQSLRVSYFPHGQLAMIVAVDELHPYAWEQDGDIIIFLQGKLEFYAAYWFDPVT